MSFCSPIAGDFRSDTVTKPTVRMGEAMLSACANDETGDDVMREDPTLHKIEAKVAALLGKEASVFVPTCTMANLLAVGAHCGRGGEVLLGSESHIFVYEQGGASWLMGAPFHPITNATDGTLPLASIESVLQMRGGGVDCHHPAPALICIENTANRCGGSALPVEYMDALGALGAKYKLPVHCDGARILNASTALGVDPARLVAGCTSVSLCLSKGLGAPLGALLAGDAAFVERARRLRKAVGGGMRQAGVIAAAALVALEDNYPKLAADHARALRVAGGLATIPGIVVQPKVDSNIVYFALGDNWSVSHWQSRAKGACGSDGCVTLPELQGASVPSTAVPEGASLSAAFCALVKAVANCKVGSYGTTKIRAVCHHQITDDMVEALLKGAAIAGACLSP